MNQERPAWTESIETVVRDLAQYTRGMDDKIGVAVDEIDHAMRQKDRGKEWVEMLAKSAVDLADLVLSSVPADGARLILVQCGNIDRHCRERLREL